MVPFWTSYGVMEIKRINKKRTVDFLNSTILVQKKQGKSVQDTSHKRSCMSMVPFGKYHLSTDHRPIVKWGFHALSTLPLRIWSLAYASRSTWVQSSPRV